MSKDKEAKVGYICRELRSALPLYMMIFDFGAGERAVKKQGLKYLPPHETLNFGDERSRRRYLLQVERAGFYDVIGTTIQGYIGQIYSRDTIISLPQKIKYLEKNADGNGLSLVQLSRKLIAYLTPFGHGFIHPDFSETQGNASPLDIGSGKVRAYLNAYAPWDIINYRTEQRNGIETLVLVVLRETYKYSSDGFNTKRKTQLRVLELGQDNIYRVSIYRSTTDIDDNLLINYSGLASLMAETSPYLVGYLRSEHAQNGWWGSEWWANEYNDGGNYLQDYLAQKFIFIKTITPQIDGKPLNVIPGVFAGSDYNDYTLDHPPLYGMTAAAKQVYRSSAIYSDMVARQGQPTIYATGVSRQWVDKNLSGKITLGSNSALLLPEGSSVGFAAPPPNSTPLEALNHWQEICYALGAKLIERKSVQQTATQSSLETNTENSILSAITKNASEAILHGLEWCARFAGAQYKKVRFRLNSEFSLERLSPQQRSQQLAEYNAGLLSKTEVRTNLHRGGIANQPDEEAEQEIEKDKEKNKDEMATFTEGNNGDAAETTDEENKIPQKAGEEEKTKGSSLRSNAEEAGMSGGNL